ncbi:MAG: hypothetical protein H0T79_24215 [Deltaproteobacteria bacterium]|nr:hypothetical protein [Deltaproteobacteria bacterium]
MSREACRKLADRLGLPADEVLEYFGERAAIREFDGGQARDVAEQGAMDDTRAAFAAPSLMGGERTGPRSAVPLASDAAAARSKR